ncbi:helix-turn-helix domain-containing protein [Bacillus tianshenii]|nr:helix-turn-helix domain-containing protein [Bacillus tianshenii]
MVSKSVARVLDTHDINEVAEIISVFLQKPVIIENKNFELIAYSSRYNYDFDPTNEKTILAKKCPLFIVDCLKKEGIVKQLQTTPDPIRVSPIEEIGLYQRVVISAQYQTEIVGYVWVQESDGRLSEDELEFLKDVSEHIGRLIYEVSEKKKARTHQKDSLLWRIINHEYQNEKFLKREAESVNLVLPLSFSVVVISWPPSLKQAAVDELKKTVHFLIGRLGKATYWLEEETKITVIIGKTYSERYPAFETANEFVKDLQQQVTNELGTDFLIGVGNEYEELGLLRKSYLEALEVINTTDFMEHDRNIIPVEYGKLGIYRYVSTIYEKNMSEGFINKDLLVLKKHDDANQSELLKTLKLYLANNCKVKQTAQQLFIHPNTLNYRIKQIRQLIPIDFDDFNLKCQLYIDLIMLDNISEYRKQYK